MERREAMRREGDPYLGYLRMESKRIDELKEKEMLRQKIKAHEAAKTRQDVYGVEGKQILKTPNVFQQKFKFAPPKREDTQILKQKKIFAKKGRI